MCVEGVCGVCVVDGWFTALPGLSQTDWTLAGWDKPAINTHTRGGATAMAVVPSARRIPPACKTPNKHPVLHLPVSCVGGPQGKPLRWRVEEQPCHTGAQCGAPPTRAGHGRAVPATLEPPAAAEYSHPSTSSPWTAATASGGAGRQRSYRHRQPSAASLPWIQPGAAQASRPSARGPGAQGPMLQEEMGEGIMPRRLGGGGYLYGLFQALREATSTAQLLGLPWAHPASPCNQLAQGHLRQMKQQPQASGLRDGGRVGLACDTGEVWR